MVQNLVLLRTVHTYILCCAVVSNLVIECRQFRHFDEVAETFLLHDVVRYIELEVGGLLGEDCRPRIETADVLTFQFLRTEVLEQQVQLRKGVADGRSRKEGRSQVLTCAFLYGTDGKEHVECLL